MSKARPGPSGFEKLRRQYRTADVQARNGGFAVVLDARVLKTPAGNDLVVESRALAEAIAAEWAGQGAEIDFTAMPLTRLANSALDRIAPAREATLAVIAGIAENDLACFRAEGPPELVRAQEEGFGPLLRWLRGRYGAEFKTATGVMPAAQPEDALARLRAALGECDALMLAGLGAAAAGCGSLILALALAEGRLDADAALALAETDESYQAGRWGVDPAYAARREAVRRDIASAARFMELCRR